jgi:hypothetical protein
VEEDRLELVHGVDGQAALAGEPQLLGRRMSAEEVMAPDGELNAERIEIPPAGEVEGFPKDALHVADEPGGPQEQFVADSGELLGNVRAH